MVQRGTIAPGHVAFQEGHAAAAQQRKLRFTGTQDPCAGSVGNAVVEGEVVRNAQLQKILGRRQVAQDALREPIHGGRAALLRNLAFAEEQHGWHPHTRKFLLLKQMAPGPGGEQQQRLDARVVVLRQGARHAERKAAQGMATDGHPQPAPGPAPSWRRVPG